MIAADSRPITRFSRLFALTQVLCIDVATQKTYLVGEDLKFGVNKFNGATLGPGGIIYGMHHFGQGSLNADDDPDKKATGRLPAAAEASLDGIWHTDAHDNWGATVRVEAKMCWGYYLDGREAWHGTCDFSKPDSLEINMTNSAGHRGGEGRSFPGTGKVVYENGKKVRDL